MIRLTPLLKELIVNDLTTGKESKNFVAWKDKLFILDSESDLSTVINHLQSHPAFEKGKTFGDIWDLVSYASEMPPDVLSGGYNPEDKSLYIQGDDKGNPVSSVLLKKVIKHLGIKTVSKTDPTGDDTTDYGSKKNVGNVPKIGFHGTNTVNLENILKYGLDTSRGPGNFLHRGVEHETDVFFASTFDDAKFYADNSLYDHSRGYRFDGIPKKRGAEPVVIELSIPDPAKIIPDFDADAHSTRPRHYSHKDKPDKFGASDMKPMGLSKEMGKFGYSGRILPSSFRWIYLYSQASSKWMKFKPSTIRKGLMKYGDEWYYTVGVGEF